MVWDSNLLNQCVIHTNVIIDDKFPDHMTVLGVWRRELVWKHSSK